MLFSVVNLRILRRMQDQGRKTKSKNPKKDKPRGMVCTDPCYYKLDIIDSCHCCHSSLSGIIYMILLQKLMHFFTGVRLLVRQKSGVVILWLFIFSLQTEANKLNLQVCNSQLQNFTLFSLSASNHQGLNTSPALALISTPATQPVY